MATKFGYVERQATNNIDWSAIGSQVVTNLQEEALIREGKKAAIDEASREMAETLRNSPSGENLTMNEFTLDYANNAQQLLLQQDKLLKAGLLKPRDYAVVRANLNESTNELFNLSKEYQTEYSNKMERMKSGQSQELETFLMASAEGLANIKNGKALIDPSTGVVSIGTWADGKMDGDPASYATVNEIRNRINSTYDIYDLNVEISSQVKLLGGNKWVEIIKAQGGGDLNQVITNMDQQQRKDYTSWEDNTIASMMNNPFHVTSILTENIDITDGGKAYEFTFDKAEFNSDRTGSLIFLDRSKDPNGQPVFKPEQEEAVKKRLQEDIRAQLNKEQDVSVSSRAFRNSSNSGKTEVDEATTTNALSDLYYGDATAVQAAEEYFAGSLGASNFQRRGKSIVFTVDGKTTTVKMGTGSGDDFTPFDFGRFASSMSPHLTGELDVETAVLESGGFREGQEFSTVVGTGSGGTVAPVELPSNDAEKRAATESWLRKNNPAGLDILKRLPSATYEEGLLDNYDRYKDQINGTSGNSMYKF